MTLKINKPQINIREEISKISNKVTFNEVVRGLGEYAGNVGIGTTSPSANLEIKGGSEPFIIYDANDEKKLRTYTQSNGAVLALTDGGNDIIRLDGRTGTPNDSWFNSGNVGIGTTNPGDKKLYVNGAIRSTASINYEDKEILSPGHLGSVAQLFVIEADSHYMVTVSRGDSPSQVTICMVITDTSPTGDVADVHIHEITNSGHYSIIYETANQSIRWENNTASNPPKINASVLKLK